MNEDDLVFNSQVNLMANYFVVKLPVTLLFGRIYFRAIGKIYTLASNFRRPLAVYYNV